MITSVSKGVAGLALVLLVAGACSSGGDGPTSSSSAEPTGSASGTTSVPPTPIPTASDGVTTIDSGDVLATVGESVGLNQNGATVFSVTMNDIGFETTCPSRLEGTVTAEQTFIIANFEAELSESFTDADTSDPFIALGSDVFAVYGKDGQVDEEAHSARAFECYSTEELIAPVIYPGETESGYVVLETDLTDGYLVFNPWGVAGSGWAWEFSK